MTTKPIRYLLLACFALGCASFAYADIIVTPTFDSSNQAAPPDTTDYEGNFYDFFTTFPPDPITIGTFNVTIPAGDVVTGATISGTFGDVNYSSTALVDLFLNGVSVGGCDQNMDGSYPPCATGSDPLATWSYTFTGTQFDDLLALGNPLDFTAVQNSLGSVVIGSPTLDLQVAPEPSLIFPLAGGLLALVAWRRRK